MLIRPLLRVVALLTRAFRQSTKKCRRDWAWAEGLPSPRLSLSSLVQVSSCTRPLGADACLSLLISRIGGLSSSLSTNRVLTAASRDQLLSDGLGDRVSAIANTELGLHFL